MNIYAFIAQYVLLYEKSEDFQGDKNIILSFELVCKSGYRGKKIVPVEREDEEEIQQCNSEFAELCTY